MGTHSASGKSRPARVKYVYVAPSDADTPVSGPEAPSTRKVAEISVWQRFRDVGLALTGVAASVTLILGGRVADYALQWSPGEHKQPAVTTEAPAAYWRQTPLSTTERA